MSLEEDFISWCQLHGSIIHGISCELVDQGYRGIVATRDIPANEIILQTPRRLLLSNASHPKPFTDALLSFQRNSPSNPLTPFQTLACRLIYESSSCRGPQPSSSFWAPYIATIPSSYTSHECLSLQDINIGLQLPSAIIKVHSYRNKTIYSWKQAKPFLLHLVHSTQEEEEEAKEQGNWAASWEAWAWASATLNSRTMHIADDPTAGVLNPFGDMFNYAPPPPPVTPDFPFFNITNGKKEEGDDMYHHHQEEEEDLGDGLLGGDGCMNTVTGYYEIKTNKSYKKGEQIFLCYGRYTNLELLIHYGFVLPTTSNGHDTVMLPLHYFPPSVAEQYNHQKSTQNGGSNNYSKNTTITTTTDNNNNNSITEEERADCFIHADGHPCWSLAVALRLGMASAVERKRYGYKALSGEMVSEEGEEKAVKVLGEVCCRVLTEKQPEEGGRGGGGGLGMTTVEEDEEMLLVKDGLKDSERVVVEWRVGQKKILQRCLDRLEKWNGQ